MDLTKQYIVQSISVASSNLRLNNQRIEVIAMLKDVISKSKDIHSDLNKMKKITELSKLAIKFSEMLHYLEQGSIDYLKITDKFREHSFNLIKELTNMLDLVSPQIFKETLERLLETEQKIVEIVVESELNQELAYGLKNQNSLKEVSDLAVHGILAPSPITIQVEQISKEEAQQFNSFENTILAPIKSIDKFLSEISINNEVPDQVNEYSRLMKVNAILSLQNGFEILSQMHEILAEGLKQLKNKSLIPSKEVIESLRACLIVIVAVVKSKDVDISNYLNRAEVFGNFLQKLISEENQ